MTSPVPRSQPGVLLVLQAGGPTAVVNATLSAIIASAGASEHFGAVLGVRHGIEGLIRGDVRSLEGLGSERLAALRHQPGAALGSSRRPIAEKDFASIASILASLDTHALLMIGGNGTMMAACELDEVLRAMGSAIRIIGVPKTVDNDILGTDRCPGYASAARFIAQSIRDVVEDVRTLPVPVSIFETMGRDSGWLGAAASLAREPECPGPQIILIPEQPFQMDAFLQRVDQAMKVDGWVVVAVSEGICGPEGRPVHETKVAAHQDAIGRPIPGDVAAFLARAVGESLGLRCRSEKPGLCGRTAMGFVAPQDLADAEAVGRAAVEAAIATEGGVMITLENLGDDRVVRTGSIPLAKLERRSRRLPPTWIDPRGEPTEGFVDYLAARIGVPLRHYRSL